MNFSSSSSSSSSSAAADTRRSDTVKETVPSREELERHLPKPIPLELAKNDGPGKYSGIKRTWRPHPCYPHADLAMERAVELDGIGFARALMEIAKCLRREGLSNPHPPPSDASQA